VTHRTTDPTLADAGAVIPSVLGLDRPLEYLPAHLVLIAGKKIAKAEHHGDGMWAAMEPGKGARPWRYPLPRRVLVATQTRATEPVVR
jgi:hypothetical protein